MPLGLVLTYASLMGVLQFECSTTFPRTYVSANFGLSYVLSKANALTKCILSGKIERQNESNVEYLIIFVWHFKWLNIIYINTSVNMTFYSSMSTKKSLWIGVELYSTSTKYIWFSKVYQHQIECQKRLKGFNIVHSKSNSNSNAFQLDALFFTSSNAFSNSMNNGNSNWNSNYLTLIVTAHTTEKLIKTLLHFIRAIENITASAALLLMCAVVPVLFMFFIPLQMIQHTQPSSTSSLLACSFAFNGQKSTTTLHRHRIWINLSRLENKFNKQIAYII